MPFLENWQFNLKLGPPLSSTNILCLKDYRHNLTKYEIKGTSEIPFCQLFSELGKNLDCNLGSQFFIFFMNWKKIKNSSQSNIPKIPKSLCELGKTWKKNPNFESMDELEKIMY